MGLILDFPTKLLQPPEESYANRETDEAHVQELIESFEEKDSTNRKGIRVVALNKDLWQTWSTATGEQREELLVPGSPVKPFNAWPPHTLTRRSTRFSQRV